MKSTEWISPLRVTLLYAVAAGLWILFSDAFLGDLTQDVTHLTTLQTYKGFVFVVVTSLLLFVILQREMRLREEAQQKLDLLQGRFEKQVREHTREIRTENEQIIHLNRRRSRFLADVSHALRTPITSINLRLELLASAPPERQEKYLAGLREQVDYLNTLVTSILDITELDAAENDANRELVDLGAVVERVVNVHRPLAEDNNLELSFSPTAELPPVRGNPQRLSLMVANLISNAIKYTPAGSVDVSLTLDDNQQMICLQVRDTGVGINPEDLPRLFDRFYRSTSAHNQHIPGSGLGLSIVKEITEQAGGRIDIENSAGPGTTFVVWLPGMRRP
jgi:two-component system, OmpR family, sensor histidine kinase SenX3